MESPAPEWVSDETAPLLSAYYGERDLLRKSYAIPGHKGNTSLIGDVVEGDRPVSLTRRIDIPSLGLLEEAERRAAHLWGANYCRFSVNGSSAANQAAICGVVGPGESILVSRSSHKSALFGLVYSGANPTWISPRMTDFGFPLEIKAEDVDKALSHDSRIRAVFITSPSYVGSLSDIKSISEVCHQRSIPLIVDAAWAGHFGFHPGLPDSPLTQGADIVVVSAHKTLPALTQGGLIFAQSRIVDLARLERVFDSMQTTSPSAAIVASLDGARAFLEYQGRERIGPLLPAVKLARKQLSGIPSITVLEGEHIDPLKLVISLRHPTLNGLIIESHLNALGIEVETADMNMLIPQITMGDSPDDIENLVDIITNIFEGEENKGSHEVKGIPSSLWSITPKIVASPREAFFSKPEKVSRQAAIGRVSTEVIAPYPPGVPVVAPGEIITEEALSVLIQARNQGIRIAYASDPTLETLMVMPCNE